MYFKEKDGKVYISDNNNELFAINSAYIMTYENEKTFLDLDKISENELAFSLEECNAYFTVKLINNDNSTAIKYSCTYNPQNQFSKKGNIHFCEEHACGLEISIKNTNRFFAIYRGSEWWSRVMFGDDLSKLPTFTQNIVFDYNSDYLCFSAFCDKISKSNIVGNEDGSFSLYAYDNCRSNSIELVAGFLALGNDLQTTINGFVIDGLKISNRNLLKKQDKYYPEYLNYLGFCSWDAFNIEVSEEKLLKKAQEFRDKNIPVKWFMIDDMWGDVKNNKLGVNSTRELYSFKADTKRFPNGLEHTSDMLHNLGLNVGLWYPTTGYWNGLDPNGEIANSEEYNDLIFWSQEGMIVHKFDKNSINKYYDRQNNFYKNCGIDFIKVDNQACLRRFSKRVMKIGEAANNLHNAIENSANKYFNGNLINCMGMSLENYWNRNSSVSRITCDYLPDSRERFNLTIQQAVFNGLFYSPIYYGDYDMFWTYDSQKIKNAVSHSISGGPVYISDKLFKTDYETLKPIVFSDGRIIRMENPAKPTKDCLFVNSSKNNKPFKIYNNDGKNGVVAAFNITDDLSRVIGTISPIDADLSADREYLAFDVLENKFSKMSGNEALEIVLNSGDDVKMIDFIPLIDKKAIIGLKGKYVPFACIKNNEILDDGKLLIYNSDILFINGKETKTVPIADNVYEINVAKGDIIEL